MVAVVSGNHLGLQNSSLSTLGGLANSGNSAHGRAGERVYINSVTGNLIIQNRDEYVSSRGVDLALTRTYNSQGLLNDDNGDNWRLSVQQRLTISGTPNQANSTVTKSFGDGADLIYRFDAASQLYVSTDGAGAHDTLRYDGTNWIWTDGSSRATETYDSTGKLLSSADADGNRTTYGYTGTLLTQITDASGQITTLRYNGSNLTEIQVALGSITQTRTRYGYDTSNRLTSVTVDLTPENAADSRTYVTTYTYDGTSRRVATISQTDGSIVRFSYEQVAGQYRVKTYTDEEGRVSTLNYTSGTGSVSVPANSSALSTTETQTTTTPRSLNSSVLTPPTGWSATSTLGGSGAVAQDVQFAMDASGNGLAIWRQGASLFVRRYVASTDTWAAATEIDTRADAVSTPVLAMDSTTGNALVAWVQSDGTADSVWVSRFTASSGAWTTARTIDNSSTAVQTAAGSLSASIRGNYAAVSWLQASGGVSSLYYAAANGTTWSTAAELDATTQSVTQASIDIDTSGYISALWRQTDSSSSTTQSIYARFSDVGPPWTWDAPSLWEESGLMAGYPKLAGDDAGNSFMFWNLDPTSTANGGLYVQRYDAALDDFSAELKLNTRNDAIYSPSIAVDQASGDAIVAWVQSDGTALSVFARRYTRSTNTWSAVMQVEAAAGAVGTAAGSVVASIRGGYAAVAWTQANGSNTNTVYASRLSGTTWSAPQALAAAGTQPGIGVDSQGRISTLWLQANGSSTVISQTRYVQGSGTPYYTVPSGATWASIAQALYGSAGVATQLQNQLGSPALTAGNQLTGFPASLTETVTTTVTVPAYYTVPAGATWASITQAVYGTSDAAAVAALQSALPNVTLTTGLHLAVPQTLTYGAAGAGLQVDIVDPLGLTTTYISDSSGRLTDVLRPAVNNIRVQTRYGYDTAGNLTSVIEDPNGLNRVTTFEYDARGNLLLTRDAAGNTITRTYSATNQLLTETRYTVADSDGAGSAQPSGALTTRYIYDAAERLRFTLSPDGRVLEHRYDSYGNRTATLHYTAARYSGSVFTEAQLSNWAATTVDLTQLQRVDYAYDTAGNLTTATAYGATNSTGAGVASTASITRYVYDQRGQLLQRIDPRGEGTTDSDYVTSYTYDSLGRVQTTTEWLVTGRARTSTIAYDDANRRTVTTYANGLVSTAFYDRTGRLVREERAAGSQALGTTKYAYDSDGRLRMVTDPMGSRQHFVYDAAGRKQFEVDGDGTLTEYVYGRTGLPVKTIQYAVAADVSRLVDTTGAPLDVVDIAALRNSAAGAAASDRISRNVYDAAGQLIFTIDAEGAVSERRYDGAAQLTDTLAYANRISVARSTDELTVAGIRQLLVAHADDRRTRYFYDADGRLAATLDAAGYLVENLYNEAGDLSGTIEYATATTAAQRASGTLANLRPASTAADVQTYFFYDGQGRQIGTLDGEGYFTETVYDTAGNVAQTTRYDRVLAYPTGSTPFQSLKTAAAGAPAQTTSYLYDGARRVVQETDYRGVITKYSYDDANNLVSSTRASGTNEARTTQARYDALGRVLQELTAEGSAQITSTTSAADIEAIWSRYGVTYAYDLAGRRISATTRPSDTQTNTTLFFYDDDGRVRFEVNSLGERTEYRYNALNQLTDKISYVNRIATTGMSGGLLTAALITTLTGAADTARDRRITYQYTLTGRIASERVMRTANSADDRLITYGYSAFGDRTNSIQQVDATRTLTHAYVYDALGQLTLTRWDAAGLNTTEALKYDAFGRLTERTDQRGKIWATRYDRLGRVVATTDPGTPDRVTTYDAFDRILTQRDALGQTTTYAYTFDATSRRMTITSPSGIVTTHTQNRHGETVTIADGRGNTTSYAYDPNGRLKTVTTPAGVTTHTYDRAGQEIETLDANGVKTVYSYDAAGRVLTRTVDPTGLALTTKTFYDGSGQAVWQQDANGVWTQTQYNRDGEVTAVVVDPTSIPNASSTQTGITLVGNTAGLNLRTEYTYDLRGKTLTVTEGAGSTKPKGTKYSYDVLGRRTQEAVDPAGLNLRTDYVYDATGNLVARRDGLGAVTRYVYSDKNQLIYSVDGTGSVIKSDYDAEGRVIKTTAYVNRISLSSPTQLGDAISAADITGRLTINAAADHVTRTVYDKDGRIVFDIDAMNAVTERKYDNAGNVIQVTRYANRITVPATVDATTIAAAISTNAAVDRTERTVYDAANRATFQIDALGYVTQSVYDNVGRVVKQVRYDAALAGTFTANQPPQIVSSAPSSGSYVIANAAKDRVTRTIYDAAGRARFSVNGEGYVTERRYDKLGRETARIQYAAQYTVADGATSIAVPGTPAANEPVTQSAYDAAGRLVQVTDAEGVVTRHIYDAVGRQTDSTVAYGTADASTIHRVFDSAGRLTSETTGYGSSEASTWSYELDAVGNRIRLIDPRAIEITETDTAWAQQMRAWLNRGYPAAAASLTAAQKTELRAYYTSTQQFDAAGRVIALTDSSGKVIATQYDAFGNAVKVTDQRGNSGYFYFDQNNQQILHVDPEGYVTRTVYNAFGNTEQVVRYTNKAVGTVAVGTAPAIATSAPSSGPYVLVNSTRDQTTLIEYDKRGMQTKITDAESNFETMAYDALGNKVRYRNKLGGEFTYTFDRVGNVKQEVSPQVWIATVNTAGTPSTPQLVSIVKDFSYDARGNRTSIREAFGLSGQQRETVFVYDRLNREVRRNLPAIAVFDPTARSYSTQPTFVATTYDRRGNVVEVRTGTVVTESGQPRDVVVTRKLDYFDALNRKTASVNEDGVLSEYTFDDVGNVSRERTYATRLPMTNLAWTARPAAAANDTYREMEYVYDANNRRTEEITQRETYVDMTRLRTQTNPNNPSDQVTETTESMYVTGQTRTANVYDAAGNLVKVVDGRGYFSLYFYNRLGQQILSVDASGYVTQLEYDANGNVIRRSGYEQKLSAATISALSVTSNPQTLITEVANKGQDRVTEFSYDRMNRKTGERILSLRYSTVSDAGLLANSEADSQLAAYEYDAAGNLKRETKADGSQFDYEYDVLSRLTRQQGPNTAVYSGVNGNTVLTTTARARTEWQYDALGNRTVETRFGLAAADNQLIRTQFDAQGNAIVEWDALNNRVDYDVDALGRTLRQTRYATDVDGVSHTYRTYLTYDALGRELTRQIRTDEATSTQVNGDTSWSSYNAFGDITARGLNSTTQAEYRYDKRGKLFWTNADTGTPRLYVYDAAGNSVLEISQAEGIELTSITSPGQVQSISPLLVQMKFSLYDARNQITDVFQPPMDFTDLTGALTAQEEQTLITTPINENGTLHETARNDPAATSTGWRVTGSWSDGWHYDWTVPPLPSGSTMLDPSTVDPGRTGQQPIPLVSWKDPPQRSEPAPGTVVETVKETVRVRNDSQGITETVTTTTTTTVTRTVTESGTSEGDIDYGSGTANGGENTTTRTITETTVHTDVKVTNYWSSQNATSTAGVVGGATIDQALLRFVPASTFSIRQTTQAGSGGVNFETAINLPAFDGLGTGPVVVRYEASGQWFEKPPVTVPTQLVLSQVIATRVQIYRGGQLLVDTANGYVSKEGPISGGTGINHTIYTYSTPSAVLVNKAANVENVRFWRNDVEIGMTRVDFNGGTQWVALNTVAGTDRWQYNLYDAGGNLIGAAKGNSANNPGSRQVYQQWRTDYQYSQRIDNDPLATDQADRDVVGQTEQSNYLRRLLYSIVSGVEHKNQIHRSSTYNAFGEVSSDTDGRLNVTRYTYNELGKLISKQDPTVSYTAENGGKANFTPITQYHVDALGQTIGTTDANGFTIRQAVRNGRMAAQFNPKKDGTIEGIERNYYDMFGNLVASTNAIGLTTRYEYDKNNRLTLTDFAGSNYDRYEYDALGNRIAHTNGLGVRERYNYDAEGRITRYRSAERNTLNPDGRTTTYSYEFRTDIGERGGYRKTTRDAAGGVLTEDIDMFGKMRRRVDLGNHEYLYQYNSAGWLKKQTSNANQNIEYSYYKNGYLQEVKDLGIDSKTRYEYDKDGNRTAESYYAKLQSLTAGTVTYGQAPHQMAVATYDALNRVVSVAEQGKYKIEYEYDKVGNRRRVHSTYFDLLASSSADEQREEQDFWYVYDAMNRFTLSMGKLVNGQIVRSDGYDIRYDAAGQRINQYTTDTSGKTLQETYSYDANGFLTTVQLNTDFKSGNEGPGVKRTERINNAVGDRIEYKEFNAAGIETSWHKYTYDDDHLLEVDSDAINKTGIRFLLTKDGRTQTTEYYNESNPTLVTGKYVYEYENWDSYQQKSITVSGAANVPGWKTGKSDFSYDVNGHVQRVYDHYENRTIQYVSNQHGQTLKRIDYTGQNTATKPVVLREFYYLYGRPIGDQGFDTNEGHILSRVDYAQSLRGSELEGNGNKTYIESKRTDAMTALWQKWTNGEISWQQYQEGSAVAQAPVQKQQHLDIGQRVVAVTSVDFDQNFQPINEYYPAATVGTYVVRTGDTLQSIAGSVWGDSSLWYLIADANGITDNSQLVDDMRLVLPNVVTNIHNNANTFRPVDPGLMLGDTSPTLPEPPPPPAARASKSKGCGVLGMVLIVAVAIVATIFTAGVASTGFAGGLSSIMSSGVTAMGATLSSGAAFATAVGAAAVGAAVSQGVAMALGMQDKFDWKAVGLSAIGQVVGAGVGQLAKAGGFTWLSQTEGLTGFASQAARGAIGSAATQGVSMAAGLQKQFSWSQVAASAIGASVGNSVGGWLDNRMPSSVPQFAKSFAIGFGSAAASAGVYEAISGERANYGLIAAQSFGTALGNSFVDAAVRREALWSEYRSEKALAGAGRDGHLEYLMSAGMTPAQAAEFVDSPQGSQLFAYMRARTAGDRPIGLMSRDEQLAQMSEFTYGALYPEAGSAAPGSVATDADALEEVYVTADKLDQERKTVIDTVAGGIDVGSRGIQKLVDVVGGAENASWVMTGISLLVAGPAKTVSGLILDEITETPKQLAQSWLGERLYDNVFVGRGSEASAHIVSDASAGVGVDFVFGMLDGGFDGAIDNATTYVKQANHMAAAEARMGLGEATRTPWSKSAPHLNSIRVKVGKNEAEWITDSHGNPLQTSGTLREYFEKTKRGSAEVQAQEDAARRGLSTDHGGHAIGHRFMGDQGGKNLFPQDQQFNNSAFRILENDYVRWIDKGNSVQFKHTLGDFDPLTGRPGSIQVDYEVFDSRGKLVHNYSQRFANEAGQEYPRQAR